jgi:hypothetical protein
MNALHKALLEARAAQRKKIMEVARQNGYRELVAWGSELGNHLRLVRMRCSKPGHMLYFNRGPYYYSVTVAFWTRFHLFSVHLGVKGRKPPRPPGYLP